MKRYIWLPLVFAIIFCAGIFVGTLVNGSNDWADRYLSDTKGNSMQGKAKLDRILSIIDRNYVDEVDIDSLIEVTIPELLGNLDPHSTYINAQDFEQASSELEGKFSGVGISFQIVSDTLNVVEVISGGPAEKVGMMAGDKIIKVDDHDLGKEKFKEDDVFKMLRGDKGTHVNVTVLRSGAREPITFEIIRDDIPVESVDVHYMITPEVGYVRVSKFARNTYGEFLNALNNLRLQGANSFIVDLRFNGGGYMEPAVLMANEFLEMGDTIVSTIGRIEKENSVIRADGSGSFKEAGVTVLINEFSASASEIFTGAIQDNDRGWVIGRRSFGKGLVQKPFVLPDNSEVRLTIQRYYSPSGRSIQKKYIPGVNEDYELEVFNRFLNGESLSADSIKFDSDLLFHTSSGRPVYGGGGIMPDIFVPEDTTAINSYYRQLINESMHIKYAFEYADLNRDKLKKAQNLDQLLAMLPADDDLLNRFANYAAQNGINRRPAYLQQSRDLLLEAIKGQIAKNILGIPGVVEFNNRADATVKTALEQASKPVVP